MLEFVFKAVLVMSVVSSALAALLLLAKPFTQKFFGYRWQYYIWYAVLIAALVPVSITLPRMHVEHSAVVHEPLVLTESFDETPPLHTDVQGASDTAIRSASFMSALSYIWLIAAIYLILSAIAEYMLFLRVIRKNSSPEKKYKGVAVRSTSLLSAPLTVGLFKKTILIPRHIESIDEKNHILLHEYTHISHRDIFYKWLCMIVRCVHWFNPLMYMVSSVIDEQCEIMCDVSVTNHMDDTEKKKYMNIILSLISRTAFDCRMTTRMAGSKQSIQKRFSAIMTVSIQSRMIKCISVVLALVVFCSVMLASGIAGSAAYDKKMPALSLDFNLFFQKDAKSELHTAPTSKALKTVENEIADAEEEVVYQKTEQNTIKGTPPEVNRANAAAAIGTKSEIQSGAIDGSDNEESSEVDTELRDDFWVYETDHATSASYPVFGEIYIGEYDMDTVIAEIKKVGSVEATGGQTNLATSYVSDTLSYESGNVSKINNVRCNDNGIIQFYMNSDYEQYIRISIEYDGRQISGNGIIPDNGTVYAIGGLDPEKTYDITVASLTGDTWKTTGEYVIY